MTIDTKFLYSFDEQWQADNENIRQNMKYFSKDISKEQLEQEEENFELLELAPEKEEIFKF